MGRAERASAVVPRSAWTDPEDQKRRGLEKGYRAKRERGRVVGTRVWTVFRGAPGSHEELEPSSDIGVCPCRGVAGRSKDLDQELAGSRWVQLSPVSSSSVLSLQSQHPLCTEFENHCGSSGT